MRKVILGLALFREALSISIPEAMVAIKTVRIAGDSERRTRIGETATAAEKATTQHPLDRAVRAHEHLCLDMLPPRRREALRVAG